MSGALARTEPLAPLSQRDEGLATHQPGLQRRRTDTRCVLLWQRTGADLGRLEDKQASL